MSLAQWMVTCLLALAYFLAGLLHSVALAKSGDLPLDRKIVCEVQLETELHSPQLPVQENSIHWMWVTTAADGRSWELLLPRSLSVLRLLRSQD